MLAKVQQIVLVVTLVTMGVGFVRDRMSAQGVDVVTYRLDDVTKRVEKIEGKIDWVLTACAGTLFAQLLSLAKKSKP